MCHFPQFLQILSHAKNPRIYGITQCMSETDRFVFHGRAGHTPVELLIIHNTVLNQGLHRHLVLEQQETVAYK